MIKKRPADEVKDIPGETGSTEAQRVLRRYWGFDRFRPLQEAVITSVMAGVDTLALMPTGGGKSLCYQVPAMMLPGLCLVISPLIALMKDQVENLRRKGITAFAIDSGLKRYEVIKTLKTAVESNCKFLYVSPERLETALFKEYLPALDVRLIAVDEAHCIAQWGHDFRPPYLRIAALREELPAVPVLALTASATRDVEQEICSKLSFRGEKIFRQSFERPNLSYSVFAEEAKINRLLTILRNVPGSSIVYCRSRRQTRQITEQLQSYGIVADFYHAGLPADIRNSRQEAWIQNRVRVIACTNAFGMGIDKPDVRTVIHLDLPDGLENYYQEAGRAGRDKDKAYAVLLYRQADLEELKKQPGIRFPDIAQIKKIYGAIAAYLQLPAGHGAGNYYDFDLADFNRRFNLKMAETIPVLKVLEQEGLLSFNEQVFIPVRLQFTCTRETLSVFQRDFPGHNPLVKLLLRSYEGIFDMPVPIYEKQLAGWLKTGVDEVKASLQRLHAHGIVSYEPLKETPQLYFLQDRVQSGDLTINREAYSARKLIFEKRNRAFIAYTQNEKDCRSVSIGNYFGDMEMMPCGICDNCLNQKKNKLSSGEFASAMLKVEEVMHNGPVTTSDLLLALTAIHGERAGRLIDYLAAEKKIRVNADGLVTRY